MKDNSTMIFSGSSHKELSSSIAKFLGLELGKIHIKNFPDGEIGVQLLENVRGRDVFIVQTISKDPNLYLMELLIIVDALKRASAKSIVAVVPYYGYARQDRKEKGRVPITARLVADLLETAGVDRLLTMDLHTEQIQGFFDIPVDNLLARPVFVDKVKKMSSSDLVVVTPDIGSVKLARAFASDLEADMAIINKRRLDAENVESNALIGEVEGKDVLLVDDIYSTGGTLKKAAGVCKALGAKKVFGAVTHGVFVDSSLDDNVDKLLVTDTIEFKGDQTDKIEVLSVGSVFGMAIKAVVENESISSIFQARS